MPERELTVAEQLAATVAELALASLAAVLLYAVRRHLATPHAESSADTFSEDTEENENSEQ